MSLKSCSFRLGLDASEALGLMANMCRMAGYLGSQRELSSLVEGPPHGLYKQSYAAKELETSVVSADGWGAAWYLPDDSEPCAYRSTLPVWGDVNLKDLGRAARSRCLMAAVRSATDPLSIAARNTQPFKFQNLSFVHNGYIERFGKGLRRELVQGLSEPVYENIAGDTDSEHLFGLVSEYWLQDASGPASERLCRAVRQAARMARRLAKDHSRRALLTFLVSDGNQMVAARTGESAKSPTLYVKRQEKAVWFASEPLERPDTGWQLVAEDSLVIADTNGMFECFPLEP